MYSFSAQSTCSDSPQHSPLHKHAPLKTDAILCTSIHPFNTLLAFATASFLWDAYKGLSRTLRNDQLSLKHKLTVQWSGCNDQRLKHGIPQCIVAFWYSRNGHFYIALASFEIRSSVCYWSGGVSGCSILHVKRIVDPFALFRSGYYFDHV